MRLRCARCRPASGLPDPGDAVGQTTGRLALDTAPLRLVQVFDVVDRAIGPVEHVEHQRAIDALARPAGRSVELAPGGCHVMLMELKQTLKEGDVVPVSLTIETEGKRSTIEMSAPARKLVE
jgi:Copper chaperone PCu(A)C